MLDWLCNFGVPTSQEEEKKEELDEGSTFGKYANVYEECSDCLLASMSIYGFADVRNLTEPGTALYDKIYSLPTSRSTLVQAFLEHKDEITGVDVDLYMSALDTLAPELDSFVKQTTDDPVTVVSFDDQFSEKELVYSIAVDKSRELIRVTFRGSTTVQDWAHDANIRMEAIENPLKKTKKEHRIRQSGKIGLHAGFRKYLFSSTAAQPEQDTSKSLRSPMIHSMLPAKVIKRGTHCKYDSILQQIIAQLTIFPNYRVQITGHSLGGALATLLAFSLACEYDNIPGPISCVSFASPRVGNGNFVRACQELELEGRLRMLRVANAEDVVTTMPDTAFTYSFVTHMFRSNFFLHGGICLQLKEDSSEWSFPRLSFSKSDHFGDDWKHRTENLGTKATNIKKAFLGKADFLRWHSCMEYLGRLQNAKKLLVDCSSDKLQERYLGATEV